MQQFSSQSCESYLFGVDRVGLTQQQKVFGVESHEQSAVHVEVPEPRGQALQPAPPDEQDHLIVLYIGFAIIALVMPVSSGALCSTANWIDAYLVVVHD